MMEAQENDDEVFVYMGGDQRVPSRVRRARIHKSVKIVRAASFQFRTQLISVEFHDGVEIIEFGAFQCCSSLAGSIKLLGIRIVKAEAFYGCSDLTDVEFGDQLETVEEMAFCNCKSLRKITMPSVRTIRKQAFVQCEQLTDLDLPEGSQTVGRRAFHNCQRLERINMPLKDGLIDDDDNVFSGCLNLTSVNLVGINKTIASLHLESWRNDLKGEINRINQILPNTIDLHKTEAIQEWMGSVIRQLNHYKTEHNNVLKEATTLLELALWKANLDDNEGGVRGREGVRTTRRQRKRARKEISITSGASIVIKNVLPFLKLLE